MCSLDTPRAAIASALAGVAQPSDYEGGLSKQWVVEFTGAAMMAALQAQRTLDDVCGVLCVGILGVFSACAGAKEIAARCGSVVRKCENASPSGCRAEPCARARARCS